MKCDICEEKPAKFLCKNCSGHLCEKCKSEHAKTKMFKKHEVVHWETNEDLVSILHCTDHTKKKLECFCDRCEKPVCTECMLLFHNGHCIKTLSDGYREIKDKTLKQREKIENEILPKYAEVLARESNKRSALTKRSAEIEQTIHRHTQSLIEMIKKVSAQTVQNLKEEEKKGLQEISSFQESVSKKINVLEQKSKTLHAEVKGNPEVLFFSSRRKDGLEQYQVLPVPPASHYLLDGFCPGSLSLRVIENGFGIVQKLKRSGQNPQTNVSQQRLTMNDENVNDSDFIYHADSEEAEAAPESDYKVNAHDKCDKEVHREYKESNDNNAKSYGDYKCDKEVHREYKESNDNNAKSYGDYSKGKSVEADYSKGKSVEADYSKGKSVEADYSKGKSVEADYCKGKSVEADYECHKEYREDNESNTDNPKSNGDYPFIEDTPCDYKCDEKVHREYKVSEGDECHKAYREDEEEAEVNLRVPYEQDDCNYTLADKQRSQRQYEDFEKGATESDYFEKGGTESDYFDCKSKEARKIEQRY